MISNVERMMARHNGRPRRVRRAYDRFRVLPLDQLRGLPRGELRSTGPAIYFLWFGPELVYIGKAEDLGQRLTYHVRAREKEFLCATFERMPEGCLRECEADYVRRYHPLYNRTSTG